MTDFTAAELRKAERKLANARIILAADLPDVATREAYMAAFHAALAFINERQHSRPKTHTGVHSRFAEAARHEPGLDHDIGRFLATYYNYKQSYDYLASGDPTLAEAQLALDQAQSFIDQISRALERPSSGPDRSADPS